MFLCLFSQILELLNIGGVGKDVVVVDALDGIFDVLGFFVSSKDLVGHHLDVVGVAHVELVEDGLPPVLLLDGPVVGGQVFVNLDVDLMQANELEDLRGEAAQREQNQKNEPEKQKGSALVVGHISEIEGKDVPREQWLVGESDGEGEVGKDLLIANHPEAKEHVEERREAEDGEGVVEDLVSEHGWLLVVVEDRQSLHQVQDHESSQRHKEQQWQAHAVGQAHEHDVHYRCKPEMDQELWAVLKLHVLLDALLLRPEHVARKSPV